MINKAFLKSQLKRIWIFTLILSLMMVAYAAFALIGFKNFFNTAEVKEHYTMIGSGAFETIKILTFQVGGPALFVTYGFYGILFLLLREVDKNYLASWLTTPMSRYKIFFTKWVVYMLGFLFICFALVIGQMVLYGSLFNDFSKGVGRLLISDLALFTFAFLALNIIWFVASVMPNNWSTFVVLAVLVTWFTVAAILGMGSAIFENPKIAKIMTRFKYFTILSLLNDACNPGDIIWLGNSFDHFLIVIPPIKASDFAWQLPLMFVVGSGLATGSMFVLRQRNFNF